MGHTAHFEENLVELYSTLNWTAGGMRITARRNDEKDIVVECAFEKGKNGNGILGPVGLKEFVKFFDYMNYWIQKLVTEKGTDFNPKKNKKPKG